MDTDLRQKVSKALGEVPIEALRFLRKDYPDFVTARTADALVGEVPVFLFHTVERSVLEEQLGFLKRNGYRTLTLEAFMAFLRGEIRLKEPSVLLTFDDGEKSWYRVAYPLLQRFGLHAVGFVVPYYLKERPDQTTDKGWLSWPELVEMDKSGVIDVQAHTYYHDRIFIEPKVVDFYHPRFSHNSMGLDTPWIQEGHQYTNQLKWGTPIYRCDSRFCGRARYMDDEEVREACISWVDSQGGVTFFGRKGWRRKLKTFYQKIAQDKNEGHYESADAQRAVILENLTKARKALEERLDKRVQHLCYPWGIGSPLSVALSREADYVSNFWCTLRSRASNRAGNSPFYVPRIKDDYIFRLPGQGRKALWTIFKAKLRRRMETLDIY